MSVLHSIRTRKCTKLFTENITEYFEHAQAVCIRPLLGGEGPGNEASMRYDFLIIVIIATWFILGMFIWTHVVFCVLRSMLVLHV